MGGWLYKMEWWWVDRMVCRGCWGGMGAKKKVDVVFFFSKYYNRVVLKIGWEGWRQRWKEYKWSTVVLMDGRYRGEVIIVAVWCCCCVVCLDGELMRVCGLSLTRQLLSQMRGRMGITFSI